MAGFRHRVSPDSKTYLVGSFPPVLHPTIPPHTLILGTMPSSTSHAQAEYYGHPSNAFWWLAGEALGFRRGGRPDKTWPEGQFSSKPAKDILQGLSRGLETPVFTYTEQLDALTCAGYALWDVVKVCSIRNSEDASIRDKEANDIRGLVEWVPSIRRIVFSGAGSARLFLSLQRSWLRAEGRFWLGGGQHTHTVFGKTLHSKDLALRQEEGLELIVPVSVSPAAAGVRFPGKREEWMETVFQPVSSRQYSQYFGNQ